MDLTKQLEPTHIPTTAELKTELEEKAKAAETPDPENDPRSKPEYTFQLSYTDARGKLWEGEFTHRVPTLAQRDIIDAVQARKKLGVPMECYNPAAIERHLFLAHLDVCLTKRPKWAENLDELLDPGILEKLYEEVAQHEAHFLGWRTGSSNG